MPPETENQLERLDALITKARAAGADAADAVLVSGTTLGLGIRLGALERVQRSEGVDLGLRVFLGKRQAIVSTSDIAPPALDELVERALAMASTVPEDPFCGLAEAGALAVDLPDLETCDEAEPATETLRLRVEAAEDSARAVAGISNSEGADAGWSLSQVAMATSGGFAGTYRVSRHTLSVSVLAGEGTAMERDYDYASAVFASDLDDAAELGARAGERAVRRLNPRRVKTAEMPVAFEPRVARSVLGYLAGATNGTAIARGTSFLKDRMGERIFPEGVTVIDDPHRRRGLRSKPFDGEGVGNARRAVIEDGVLKTWLLDSRAARQLGLSTTGHASRGTSSPPAPAPTNLYLEPGPLSPEEMIKEIGTGLLVTEMMGMGVSMVTGDYSRGATGFWIEHGEVAYPVSEVTVAGNLKDMFRNLTPANDLQFRYGADAPSLRIDGLTVAGT